MISVNWDWPWLYFWLAVVATLLFAAVTYVLSRKANPPNTDPYAYISFFSMLVLSMIFLERVFPAPTAIPGGWLLEIVGSVIVGGISLVIVILCEKEPSRAIFDDDSDDF